MSEDNNKYPLDDMDNLENAESTDNMSGADADNQIDQILNEAKNSDDEYYDDSEAMNIDPVEEPQEDFEDTKKKKKKKKHRFFGRKRDKTPDFDESEDTYYGMPVKPLSDLRRGFDSTGEITTEENTYANLFDDTLPALDEEMEKNFQRIQKERRRKVAEAVETAGVDVEEVADELGIVAPMPVTSFSADPYTKQNGISTEGNNSSDEFQKAMEQSANEDTMEIKLNVLNDTVELQKTKNIPAVDEDTVSEILSSVQNEEEAQTTDTAAEERPEAPEEDKESREDGSYEQISFSESTEDKAEDTAETAKGNTEDDTKASQETPDGSDYYDVPEFEEKDRKSPNSFSNFPQITDIHKYRDKTVQVHMMNIDVLQSALLSEVNEYEEEEKDEKVKNSPFKRFKKKSDNELPQEEQESIDDYTSPQDAKSVATEIKATMRELSVRLFVTGLSTLILFIITAIFENKYSVGDGTENPTAYIIMSLLFLAVVIGFCYKSLLSGFRGIVKFRPNSDSAAAVAAVVVAVQILSSFFYSSQLSSGEVHFYTALVALIMFLNTVGKLTMVRRIYSNFRFVSSREQKYTVKIYDDYNTALKLTADTVSGSPGIAYQKKAGFLKRFLQLSYEPDPSEAASQTLAPLGLVLSLLLCLVCVFITKNIAVSIAALAAASCISVSFTNMIGCNFPISRLSKRTRRAGALVSGYNAVEAMADTNAVMLDAGELFPAGTVVLDGVKGLGDGDVDSAVFSAAALIRSVGGPIADVFNQVNDEDETEHKVSGIVYEDDNGVSGIVDGKSIIIGSRNILLNHNITPPERDDVIKFTVGGKKPLFIAVDGNLVAMLLLVYKADRRKKLELQKLDNLGVSLIVRSTDPNITAKLLSKLFDIPSTQINIITGELGETYSKLIEDEIPRADALVATKGRCESLMYVISACIHEKRAISIITLLQNIAVILGFVLVAFLSCFSGIKSVSALNIIVYELFWLAAVVLLPKIKKF